MLLLSQQCAWQALLLPKLRTKKRKKSRKSNETKKTAKHAVKRKKKHVARKKQIRKQLTDVNTKLIARLKPDAKTANVPKTKEAKNNKRFRHFI